MAEHKHTEGQMTTLEPSLMLTQAIAQAPNPALDQAPDFYWALNAALNHICETTDWDYGEVWLSNKSGTFLARSPIWSLSDRLDVDQAVSWMQFRRCSASLIQTPAEELPGRVWRSQQPEWIDSTSAPPKLHCLQGQIPKIVAQAGLAIPLLLRPRTRAVLGFFMAEARQRDEQLVQVTQAAVTQLEQLLLRFLN